MSPNAIVRADGVFEIGLGGLLVVGAAGGWLDGGDFPTPVGKTVLVVVGVALIAVGSLLWRLAGGAVPIQLLRSLALNIHKELRKHDIALPQPQKADFDEDPILALDTFLDDVEAVLEGRKIVILINMTAMESASSVDRLDGGNISSGNFFSFLSIPSLLSITVTQGSVAVRIPDLP